MMQKFSEEKLNSIFSQIDKALLELDRPPVAAFDADGTLWNMDMSEHFFKYKVRENLLPGLPENPWEYYVEMHKEDPPKSYLWLAQVNQGFSLEEVRGWAKDFLKNYGEVPVFEEQKKIINYLKNKGVEVYVVTASIKWAVEPGAALCGVDQDHVVGVSTKVNENGIVTAEQEGPITWRQGKVDGILEATKGVLPFFAAGNSDGDLPLLESASHVRLVMSAAVQGEPTYESEQMMLKEASQRGWFSHSYNG